MKRDAVAEFEADLDGLDYESDGPGDQCGECAVRWMEAKIRSQPGYVEEPREDGFPPGWLEGPHPGPCPLCGEDEGCIHQPWHP